LLHLSKNRQVNLDAAEKIIKATQKINQHIFVYNITCNYRLHFGDILLSFRLQSLRASPPVSQWSVECTKWRSD